MAGSMHGLSFPQHLRPDCSQALTQDTAGREIGWQRLPQLLHLSLLGLCRGWGDGGAAGGPRTTEPQAESQQHGLDLHRTYVHGTHAQDLGSRAGPGSSPGPEAPLPTRLLPSAEGRATGRSSADSGPGTGSERGFLLFEATSACPSLWQQRAQADPRP